jgi:predicted nicotinamide N-methyase
MMTLPTIDSYIDLRVLRTLKDLCRSMTKEPTAENRARAHGRWKLLREALLSSKTSSQANDSHSIHRFPGYNQLQACNLARDTKDELERRINAFDGGDPAKWMEQVESALLVRLALLDDVGESPDAYQKIFEFPIEDCSQITNHYFQLDLLTSALQSRHSIEAFCECTKDNDKRYTVNIQVKRTALTAHYLIVEYPIPDTNQSIFIRQRNRSRAKLSVAELASHRFHDGVDNTGNVCIWDAEKTLAWVLLQEHQQGRMKHVKIVTELGVGMAGLAALACASLSDELEEVYLTDGHIDCVQNNQLNAFLWKLQNPEKSSRMHGMQLLWTTDTNKAAQSHRPPPANWTLVSDCTHFQEYHAALFWTLVQCTHVGGTIWMCQPNRGQSWARFCQLVVHVNLHGTVSSPLLSLQEQRYSTLDIMHEQFVQHSDLRYDPNIHRPRVFCLVKLREATEHDRQQAIWIMETRDNEI